MRLKLAFCVFLVAVLPTIGGFPSGQRAPQQIYNSKSIHDFYGERQAELLEQPQVLIELIDLLIQVVTQQQGKMEMVEESYQSLRREIGEIQMDNTYVKKYVVEQIGAHHPESAFKPRNSLAGTSNMFLPWDNYFKARAKPTVDDLLAMNDSISSLSLRVESLNQHLAEVDGAVHYVRINTVDHFARIINNVLPVLQERVEAKYAQLFGPYSTTDLGASTTTSAPLKHKSVSSACSNCPALHSNYSQADGVPKNSNSTSPVDANKETGQYLAARYGDSPTDIKKLRQANLVKRVTGSRNKVIGAWMQDGCLSSSKVWSVPGYRNLSFVDEYKNILSFANDRLLKRHMLPFRCGGTGHLVYNNSFYCPAFKSNRVCRYDLKTSACSSTRLPGKNVKGVYGYSIEGFNYIDLASDSLGIWAIYTNEDAQGNIIVMKLDPLTLERIYVSRTSVRQQSIMNCFMIFGNLFAIKRHKLRKQMEIRKIWSIHNPEGEQTWKKRHDRLIIQEGQAIVNADFNPKHLKLYFWNWEGISSASLMLYEFDLM